MKFRHLRYFLAVAEHGGFARAAAALHIAQPPLSRQIAALERELGVQLIDRSRRQIALTPAGAAFRDDARRILAELDRSVERCRTVADSVDPLRIDFVPSTFAHVVPQVLGHYHRSTAGHQIRLTERRPDEVVRSLDAGDSDAGFVRQYKPRAYEALGVIALLEEPLIAVVPAAHRLAGRSEIDIEELADDDFILNEPNPRGGLRETIEGYCRERGFTPRPVQQPWLLQTSLGLVEAGLGVSVTALSVGRTLGPNSRFLTLRGCPPLARTELVWNPARSKPAVQRLIAAAALWKDPSLTEAALTSHRDLCLD